MKSEEDSFQPEQSRQIIIFYQGIKKTQNPRYSQVVGIYLNKIIKDTAFQKYFNNQIQNSQKSITPLKNLNNYEIFLNSQQGESVKNSTMTFKKFNLQKRMYFYIVPTPEVLLSKKSMQNQSQQNNQYMIDIYCQNSTSQATSLNATNMTFGQLEEKVREKFKFSKNTPLNYFDMDKNKKIDIHNTYSLVKSYFMQKSIKRINVIPLYEAG